jgi:trehalose 6-phosphate synthase/phosphatase
MAVLNNRIEQIFSPIFKIFSPDLVINKMNTFQILKTLSSNLKNRIVIISGREKDFLEKQFKNIDATLIAEHGYFIKEYGKDWEKQVQENLSWKEKILPILEEYVNWCPGSIIEHKHASLTWHYRNVDQKIAAIRIHELKHNLSEILNNESKLQIIDGNKVLEIKSIMYDKGTAAQTLLKGKSYDFIMAVGDDKTDEDLFRVMPPKAISIKIGTDPSLAEYSIKEQPQLYDILNAFNEVE